MQDAIHRLHPEQQVLDNLVRDMEGFFRRHRVKDATYSPDGNVTVTVKPPLL